jgi:hypothetical protein
MPQHAAAHRAFARLRLAFPVRLRLAFPVRLRLAFPVRLRLAFPVRLRLAFPVRLYLAFPVRLYLALSRPVAPGAFRLRVGAQQLADLLPGPDDGRGVHPPR